MGRIEIPKDILEMYQPQRQELLALDIAEKLSIELEPMNIDETWSIEFQRYGQVSSKIKNDSVSYRIQLPQHERFQAYNWPEDNNLDGISEETKRNGALKVFELYGANPSKVHTKQTVEVERRGLLKVVLHESCTESFLQVQRLDVKPVEDSTIGPVKLVESLSYFKEENFTQARGLIFEKLSRYFK